MLNQAIAGQTLLISLKSWRYILSVSLFASLNALILLHYQYASPWGYMASFMAGFVCWFFCWRLWQDEQFFKLFYQDEAKQAEFDLAIQTLWSKNLLPRTLEQRWQGVSQLIKKAWLSVAIQWLCVVVLFAC